MKKIYEAKHSYVNPATLIKPLINMYHGQKNNARYRQYLSDAKRLKNEALSDVIKEVLEIMRPKEETARDPEEKEGK